MFKPVVTIFGPTASGKSAFAILLAKKINGEVIVADSRQIYRGMDIGTAKNISDKDKNKKNDTLEPIKISGVNHYLINICDLNETFNVALFKKAAFLCIEKIVGEGKWPIVCGGTPLYISAITRNLNLAGTLPNKKLRETLEKTPTDKLFEQYLKLDPEGAKNIDKRNKRRLVRAIEVCLTTGKPFWQQRTKKSVEYPLIKIYIKPDKERLKQNISLRVDEMLKAGLNNEAYLLIKKFGNVEPLKTIGYQEFATQQKSNLSRKDLIIAHTWQFAKRQINWFDKEKNSLKIEYK